MSELTLAVLQRVCTPYRLELFRRLAARPGLRVRLFIGDDLAVMAYHARAGLWVARVGVDWFYGE